MENCLAAAADDPYRGHDGPLVLERGPATNPLFGAFFEAVQQAGYQLTDDVNGYRQEGFAPFDRNIRNGRRLSAARAYLHPVMRAAQPRRCETRAFVTKILFEGTRAVGVEYRARPRCAEARDAAGEVILCGGAINSPQLLQLSGVGNADELRALGRRRGRRPARRRGEPPGPPRGLHPVRLQAAGVGGAVHAVAVPPVDRVRSGCSSAAGPGATNHFEGGGFARSNDDVAYPNLMFHFLPIAVRYDGSAPAGDHGYQVHIGPMYSDARGLGEDHEHRPARAPGAAVQLPVDRAGPARVGRGDPGRPRRSSNQPAFDPFNGGELSPGPAVETDERDPRLGRARRRDGAASLVHLPDGRRTTCRWWTRLTMRRARSGGAARWSTRRSMPYITNGNIYAPVMMVAEKAADLILGNTAALPPENGGLLPPQGLRSERAVHRAHGSRARVAGSRPRHTSRPHAQALPALALSRPPFT